MAETAANREEIKLIKAAVLDVAGSGYYWEASDLLLKVVEINPVFSRILVDAAMSLLIKEGKIHFIGGYLTSFGEIMD